MGDQLYYAIVQNSGHLEFHVSRAKREVKERRALSKRIALDSSHRAEAERGWRREVDRFRMKKA